MSNIEVSQLFSTTKNAPELHFVLSNKIYRHFQWGFFFHKINYYVESYLSKTNHGTMF
jgi:hypothetical protein